MRKKLTIIPATALLLMAACTSAPQPDPMAGKYHDLMLADSTAKADVAAQEATAKTLYDLINTSSTDGIENLATDNFVDHQMPEFITTPGLAGLKEEMTLYHTAFPDFHQDILGMATNGDRTYVLLHITGTNKGAWGDMPATNKPMDVMGCDVLRFENGKVAEHWGYMEEAKMMQQLGMMPAPDAAKPAKK